jgi:hypothetical protein
MHEHLNWTPAQVQASLARVTGHGWVQIAHEAATLTAEGVAEVRRFRNDLLRPAWQNDAVSFAAIGD